jgi:uncharacterized membrane protein YqgA involved in biofilm formation
VLDGVGSVAFASALGWGVLTVLVVQGALTLEAHAQEAVMRDPSITKELFATGGIMMLGLGSGCST